MNPVAKELWLTALRSGEYTQGRKVLAHEIDGSMRHCCLGVLCEVAIQNGVNVPVTWDWSIKYYGATGQHKSLPAEVIEWSGVSEYGRIPESDTQLSSLNDISRMSFNEIADIIEEKL